MKRLSDSLPRIAADRVRGGRRLRAAFNGSAFVLLAISTPLFRPLRAADLWVDAQAAIGGDGRAARPFRTIQAAALQAAPGDTVRVRPGVYRERVMPPRGGEAGRPIRYVSEVRHGAVVKGSDLWTPAWRDEGGDLYSAELDAALFSDADYVDGGNPYRIPYEWDKERNKLPPAPYPSVQWTLGQVFLDGVPVRETSSRAELARDRPAWWFDAAANRLVLALNGSSPAERRVELTTRRGVFRPKEKGLGYIEVHGFIFEHCANQFPARFWTLPENAQSGMVGTRGGHHWVIADNIIRHAKSIGLSFGASGVTGGNQPAFDNERPARADGTRLQIGFHRIAGNRFEANGAIGAMGSNHTQVVFEHNVFLGNNALRNTAYETGGIKTHGAYELRIEGNWFVDNECMGVWLDNTWRSCRLSRNVFVGNRGRAVFLEMDDNTARTACLVDCNLFLDGRPELVSALASRSATPEIWRPWVAGIYGHDADGVRILHNLFAGEGYGLYFRKISNRKGGAAQLTATGNLFIGDHLTPVCLPVDNPPAVQGNFFDANVYPPTSRTTRFAVTGWSRDPKLGLDQPGLERVLATVGGTARSLPPFGDLAKPPAGYYLDLDQWRVLTRGDQRSAEAQLSCTLDRATWTLTLNVPETGLRVSPAQSPEVRHDFLGRPVASWAGAGPFAVLGPGAQRIKLSQLDAFRGAGWLAPPVAPGNR